MTAGAVVADGVVAQIGQQFAQKVAAAADHGGRGTVLQRDVGAAGIHCHAARDFLCKGRQIHRHKLHGFAGFGLLAHAVQLGKLQNIRHKRNHPLGFLVNPLTERGNVLGARHAVFNQFRIARNACERRFQLVAHIGRELPADGLVVLAQLAVGLNGMRKGNEFFIGNIGLDCVKMLRHTVNGAHHLPRNGRRQHRRQHDDEQADHQQHGQDAVVAAPDIARLVRQTQNGSV